MLTRLWCVPTPRAFHQPRRLLPPAGLFQDSLALLDQAITLSNTGKYAEAHALYEQLVAMAEAEHGPEHPQVMH
jgi:hypothetical protein